MTLTEEMNELHAVLNKNNIQYNDRTPFGILEQLHKLSKDDYLTVNYNQYWRNSLLDNGNRWIVLEDTKELAS
jgi:hypothetical protein